jgi:hypothetical protein
MSETPGTPPHDKQDSKPVDSPKKPKKRKRPSPEAVDAAYKITLDGYPMLYLLAARADSEQLKESGVLRETRTYMDQYIAELNPANSVERMLAVQMLWQHARIGMLIGLASDPENLVRLGTTKALQAAIDQALNTSRRQTLAWQQLKAPRSAQFIRGEQVNFAEQQVVANRPGEGGTQSRSDSPPARESTAPVPANEQGLDDDTQRTPAALPAQYPGSDILAGIGKPREAVGVQHRPEDVRG